MADTTTLAGGIVGSETAAGPTTSTLSTVPTTSTLSTVPTPLITDDDPPSDKVPDGVPGWTCGTTHSYQKMSEEFSTIKVSIDLTKYSSGRVENYGDAISHLFIFNRNYVCDASPTHATPVTSDNPKHISVPNPTYDPSTPIKFKTTHYSIRWDGPYGFVRFSPCVVSVQMMVKMAPLPANYILYGSVWFTDKVSLINKLVTPYAGWIIPKTRHILDVSLDEPNPFNAVNIKGISELKLVINGITSVNLTKTLMIMYKKFVDPDCYILNNGIIGCKTHDATTGKHLSADVKKLLADHAQYVFERRIELTQTKVFNSL